MADNNWIQYGGTGTGNWNDHNHATKVFVPIIGFTSVVSSKTYQLIQGLVSLVFTGVKRTLNFISRIVF
jgi:hypothetical protein